MQIGIGPAVLESADVRCVDAEQITELRLCHSQSLPARPDPRTPGPGLCTLIRLSDIWDRRHIAHTYSPPQRPKPRCPISQTPNATTTIRSGTAIQSGHGLKYWIRFPSCVTTGPVLMRR